jgi:hypothetical protein
MQEFLDLIESVYYPQQLDPEWDGCCPCFNIEKVINGKSLHIQGKCWRVSMNFGEQDLYVWGNLPQRELECIAEAFKKRLDEQQWYNEYIIRYYSPD